MEKKFLGAKNVRSQTTSLLFWKFLTERPGGFEQVTSAGTKPFFSASFSRDLFLGTPFSHSSLSVNSINLKCHVPQPLFHHAGIRHLLPQSLSGVQIESSLPPSSTQPVETLRRLALKPTHLARGISLCSHSHQPARHCLCNVPTYGFVADGGVIYQMPIR